MQYFKPAEGDRFVGDCMPFFHDGTFHLFYLLDEGHHRLQGGLGGHQWAHATTADLIRWTHHPLAISITEEWEASICTGSVFFYEGTFYAFYATRMPDWTQHLGLATSQDGIRFQKTKPNPFASPPKGYSPYHFRDPVVFRDDQTGFFHMLVTAWLKDYPIPDRAGCLAHLVSSDLRNWETKEPFLIPGLPGPPECPDYFEWDAWHYLIFSNGLVPHYRLSHHPFGPWTRPKVDTLDGALSRVMKTAPFTGNRRFGVAWLGTREGDKDDGKPQWAGNAVFREIIQHADGSLGASFLPEMVPGSGTPLDAQFTAVTPGVAGNGRRIRMEAMEGLAVGMYADLPQNVHITAEVVPRAPSALFGLRLRGTGQFEDGYNLRFRPYESQVDLHNESIFSVEGLDQPFSLDVILKHDIIDVCIDKRRCLINRCPERRGDRLFLFCQDGDVAFEAIDVAPLL